MSKPAPASLDRLEAAAVTGQCANPFFRREQLKALHDVLRENAASLVSAIEQDTGASTAEAKAEFAVATDIVRDHHASIDAGAQVAQERAASARETRTVPWGVVFVDADLTHTPFFNIISALSAAVAGGNCVALKLENSLRALPSLLRTLLPRALAADNFTITHAASSAALSRGHLEVLQKGAVDNPTQAQLVSPRGRTVAIVDRTAHLDLAARNLVTARFAFGGSSPYSPDLIVVNEYVKQEFLDLVLRHAVPFFSRTTNATSKGQTTATRNAERLARCLDSVTGGTDWKTSIITKGDQGAVIDMLPVSKKSASLSSKIDAPIFAITSMTSLDHAIDLISQNSSEHLLAAYHFAAPSHAEYLAQFVPAHATFLNHVPTQLLLGPAAPVARPFSLTARYTKEHFMHESPVFAASPSNKKAAALVILDGQLQGVDDLMQKATVELKESKRAESIAIGFFEQGIFIGLGLYGIPLLTCLGFGAFYAVRAGMRHIPFHR